MLKIKLVSILTILLIIPVVVVAESQLNKIKGVTVSNVTINSASVSWNKSNQAKYYQLRLQNRNSETIKTWKDLSKNSKNISESIGLLTQGKKYQVKVRACVKNDCSKWSDIKSFTTLIDADDDGVDSTLDCNDNDLNENAYVTYYVDEDSDSYGSTSEAVLCAATPPSGYSTSNTDCSDTDDTVSSNQTYYRDADADGKGSATDTTSVCSYATPTGYVTNSTDANDSDYDNDGTASSSDCNDSDSSISAFQTYYLDADQDGLGLSTSTTAVCSSTAPAGYVTNSSDTNDDDYDNDSHVTSGDCNDHDATVYTTYYADVDQDGYGNPNSTTCAGSTASAGYVSNSNDADDNDYFNGNYPSCSSDIYNCTSFSTQFRAQKYYNYCVTQGAGDIHNLDGDADGEACENLS